jgi:Bacterial cadherin-like domain
MQFNRLKYTLKSAVQVLAVLLLGAGWAAGQQAINLNAGPTSISLPDGSMVPMWGYTCGDPIPNSTATCGKLNPTAAGWSPVVITVPTGQTLQINLTNNLSFASGANKIPTSLTIVGQIGGGLGSGATTTASPKHNKQTLTWPASSTDPADPVNNPPQQNARVQSFATEVAAGTATSLTWANLNPGTYLLESGTHPSIQGPMGLFGMVVVTAAPSGTTAGTAYPNVSYNADIPLLFSEIDAVQNNAVQTAVNTSGFSETRVWSGLATDPNTGLPGCGNPGSGTYYQTCYPPAVNYSPRYYLINGVAFNKSNPSQSLFPTAPATGITPGTGKVLVRMVNAGLRMHIPSIVGSQTGTSNPPASGFGLIAEDGNPLPGVTRVQTEVFMAPGKTYDVMINAPSSAAAVPPALPIFDREGSLSGNGRERDAGMLAYIGINGAAAPNVPSAAPVARPDQYTSLYANQPLTVSDPTKGLIANDSNVYSVAVSTQPAHGTVTLQPDGTFTYSITDNSFSNTFSDTFGYCANGTAACAIVTLKAAPIEAASGIKVNNDAYTSNLAKTLVVNSPGVLGNDVDGIGYPLSVSGATSAAPLQVQLSGPSGGTVTIGPDGGFSANVPGPGTYTFTYKAANSQGTVSTSDATVTLTFLPGSKLAVTLIDGKSKQPLNPQDYRWLIEEDRTWFQSPNCAGNPAPAGCPTGTGGIVPAYGTNFHTSHMPVIAQGCTGDNSCENGQSVLGVAAACDVGNGICRSGVAKKTVVMPGDVALDPNKRYYISVLPGDSNDPGHAMGGAEISYDAANQVWQPVNVIVEPGPLPTSTVSAFVFEDDFPMNGEDDTGGGVDVLAPNEPGLGGFNIEIWDNVGQFGDPAGQMTYDMFNQPLSNSLAGTIDPATNQDACPIGLNERTGADGGTSPTGISGLITVCPKYEGDGKTLSPLAGQAVVRNLPPGFYGIEAHPGADRIARGEEWLQTNTLDGGFAHDAFVKASEPSYFQEYGPAGFHVAIGFANPAIINNRKPGVCANRTDCTHTIKGKVTLAHMSRTPDERLYSTETNDAYSFTQTYVSLGSPDGADFAFAKTADDGTFTFSNMPGGDWRVTVFDQWTDLILDGYTTPVRVNAAVVDMGDIAVHQWRQNLYTRTFFDENGDGVSQDNEPGLTFVPTNIRYRDGSYSNFNSTDLDGFAGFNEVFPIFNWYVVETDATRYKNTGTHVVYDAGGPVDGSKVCSHPGLPACANSSIGQHLARTQEDNSLPADLRVPGSVYCDNADCTGFSINPAVSGGSNVSPNCAYDLASGAVNCDKALSTGRIDPPWVQSYGWQGFLGQAAFLEFGKKPFAAGENGGIRGHVVYASTRPFDDPALLLQLSWEPLVPNVTINLYQEGTAPDGSKTLKLVDTTQTSSWDDWAQGFRKDANGNPVLASDGKPVPNISCPGQSTADPFYFTLYNQPELLNMGTDLPYHSQYKCFDGMHNWNQLQPAPYNGMYQFPSVKGVDPQTGKPAGTNCTICTANHAAVATDWDYGQPMLPAGKYIVEMIVPPGYELVKEEDKNILMGDAYNAPVSQQFGGFGNIYILPDQAAVGEAYNANNPLMPTANEGATPRHEGDTGSVEEFWPCVGAPRVVPDYMSLYPQSGQNAPFAGATRPLCDRKEVTLEDQSSVLAKFYVFTSTHIAGHFTGIITDDFTSEFDPFSPAFGEKFEPPYLPVSVKDWAGNEVSRVYSDQWGIFNGLAFSSWGVNPPDPSGFVPQTFVMCMNDRGSGNVPDPLYSDSYSQFCYEWPMMPGETSYLDTPVVPNTAFAEGYNHPDCDYPDATPAIASVYGDLIGGSQGGPWVSTSGKTLTINALGDQQVNNYGYSGPSATTEPFNKRTITRHYGFGATQGSGTVTIGGISATVNTWSDSQIVVQVPATGTGANQIHQCTIQQQAQYSGGAGTAYCGQLVITAGNGKQSIDAVTVTIGGKQPTVVQPGKTVQSAIDAAAPGDLVIVPAGKYKELLIMWKPVVLQGVGAASTVIDGDTHPSGVIDPWRHQINCLFGLALNGQPYTANNKTNPYDASGALSCPGNGWNYFTATPNHPQVDRIPFEGILGWDTTVNGNLAEMLQEPTLMGSYEGAGITVLSKGVRVPENTDWFGVGAESAFPDGTTLLTSSTADCGRNRPGDRNYVANPFPSNFQCNPSRIDGLMITNSSQGGGGILVHGWGHNIELSNNRVRNNNGTLSGGIEIGQGEFGDGYFQGDANNPAPGSCQNSNVANTQLPFCFNTHTNIHNNMITLNSSTGDELFTSTPSGAGGVTFCIGSDYYKFNYNWVCGNMSSGDGGGIAHLGLSYNGNISKNTILFNQSVNPTVPTSGGGLVVMGPAPDGTTIENGVAVECGTTTDVDCVPGLSDGAGPGLIIDGNLFLGNSAESGSGGGIRFQAVNGTDVVRFPTSPNNWYSVNVTNNIIANNVAGWDGGGVGLLDSLAVNFTNNTIVSNDTTASAGTLFNAYFSQLASDQSPPPGTCTNSPAGTCTASQPQAAGLSVSPNSPQMTTSLPGTVTCPSGHASGTLSNGDCRRVSYPLLTNNIIWHNRAFHIEVGGTVDSNGTDFQQSLVSLHPILDQPTAGGTTPDGYGGVIVTGGTGGCVNGASFWDIGARGDTGPTDHSSGFTLKPQYSVLTDITGYSLATNHNMAASAIGLVSQYCNGSRIPPELKSGGYQVPPGTNEGTVPVPVFSLLAGATVDEGNNWVNMKWGPLAMTSPVNGSQLGNYGLTPQSPVRDAIVTSQSSHPSTDFFGNPRPSLDNPTHFDVGAVEYQAPAVAVLKVTPASLTFTGVVRGTTSAAQALTLHNTGGAGATINSVVVTAPFSQSGGTCGATLAAGSTCTINIVYSPSATDTSNSGTVTITANVPVAGSPVPLSGTGVAAVIAASLTPASRNYGTVSRNCPGTTIAQRLACTLDPAQVFTLTNTGNVPLTGITNGLLGGTNPAEFGIASLISTCGPAIPGTQPVGNTTLAPGGTCVISMQFKPLTAQSTGVKTATISVTDAAGTQSSTLIGTAN